MRTRANMKGVRIVNLNRRIRELEDRAWIRGSPQLGRGRVEFALILIGVSVVRSPEVTR